MSTIDKAALIEQAAKASGYGKYDTLVADIEAALPVIAKALLAPLREVHVRFAIEETWCDDCGQLWPCPTVRLLDAIETEVSA